MPNCWAARSHPGTRIQGLAADAASRGAFMEDPLHIYLRLYIYIHMHRERERERKKKRCVCIYTYICVYVYACILHAYNLYIYIYMYMDIHTGVVRSKQGQYGVLDLVVPH